MKYLLIAAFLPFLLTAQVEDPVCSKEKMGNSFQFAKVKVDSSQLDFDVSFYDLFLDISYSTKTVTGSNRIKGSVIASDSINTLVFDFNHPMLVDNVTRTGDNLGFVHANNLITVDLGRKYGPGEFFDIEIAYHGNPEFATGSDGWKSFNFDTYNSYPMIWTLSEPYGARSWWPCKDTPLDKADSMNIAIRVPVDQYSLEAVSNGLLKKTEEVDGKKTFYWETRYPMATYLASIGIYPYVSWREWFHFSESDSMPLDYYVFENWLSTAQSSYRKTSDMMTAFNEMFGEYPFKKEKYGHYMFLFGGGMEHQTMTGLGSFNETLIAHELGHQWFGDKVTCSDFSNIWINEGFARYSEALWLEYNYGVQNRKNYMKNIEYYGNGTVYVPENAGISRIFSHSTTYNKGGWVVQMLRYISGDEIFFKVLKQMTTDPEFANATINTEQLKTLFQEETGQDLNNFFDQWVYGEYTPEYSYDWRQDGDTLKYQIIQSSGRIFDMPVEIRMTGQNDTITIKPRVFEDSLFGIYLLDEGVEIESVILDPDNWILNKTIRGNFLNTTPYILEDFSIGDPYPNPFNPEVNIDIYLENDGIMEISIFNINGESVLIESKPFKNGSRSFTWNGRSSGNKIMPAGQYFISFHMNNTVHTRKVILLK